MILNISSYDILAICIASSVKGLCKSFAHFSVKLFEFFLLIYKSSSYNLDSNPILVMMHCKYPLPVCDLPFFSLKLSYNERKFNKVKSSHLFLY